MNKIKYIKIYPLVSKLKKQYNHLKKLKDAESLDYNNSFHVITEAYKSVKNSLEANKTLPTDGFGKARILSFAEEYFNYQNSSSEYNDIIEYMIAVGDKTSLQNGEIWLFPEMLKYVLIEKAYENAEDEHESIKSIIVKLKHLNNLQFEDLYEKLSKCESLLNRDENYNNSDSRTKDLYRHLISVNAKKSNCEETDIVLDLLDKAKRFNKGKKNTIGYYLLKDNRSKLFYFPTLLSVTFVLILLAYALSGSILIAISSFIPIFYISRTITEKIFSLKKATYVPRIKSEKAPKTLVTVISFINDEKSVDDLCDKCIRNMYSNNTEGLLFGFLADLPTSCTPLTPQDNSIVAYAEKKIRELNSKHGDLFFCAIREKDICTEDGLYKGKERKRGAIEDFLNAVEKGASDRFLKISDNVYNAKYFTALDSDTVIGINSVKELISVLENSLHEPQYNTEGTAITDGYAIAVPRIETLLDSAVKNRFTKIFCGKSGSETYNYSSFSLYKDIFENGIFSGKGVISIKHFNRVLRNILNTGNVLSHDILEGEFLNTIFVSDVVFYDSFPKNILTYTSRKDRWIRGDWQNLRFLKNKIRKSDGTVMRNPLRTVSKFKILDNVLRSLQNPSLLSLMLIYLLTGNIFIISEILLFIFIDFIAKMTECLINPTKALPLFYRNGIYTDIVKTFLYGITSFILLPFFALRDIIAITKASIRMITKKNLLEWKTSAQNDIETPTKNTYIKSTLIQLVGILFLFKPITFPIALLWLMGIPYSLCLSSINEQTGMISESDVILKEIWSYFNDSLNEKYNYLPPDNFQEKPLGIYANRTSPTNIGLALLSVLGAYDMGFINEERLIFLTDKIVSSVESLEKYNGHLFNWYEVTSKSPLKPKFISTVDNGNFICCLHTLKNGLKDFSSTSANDLTVRIERIIENTDMAFLFDKKRKLFYIGYDPTSEEYSMGHYDLYASESRLLSYYAIASGQITEKHWQSLKRPTTFSNGTVGIKSWSGTAFEYLMPHLLLPIKKGSFAEEMILFAINAQINRTKKIKAEVDEIETAIPWGISESCYHSLGSDIAYQYKAFGTKALAVSEDTDTENEVVVSPYSTFLSMPFDKMNTVKNLNLLSEYDSRGKYGYYEAIDFHKTSKYYTPKTVYTFMTHHLGMSFISLLNIKHDNIMQKRFMDERMEAFSLLLEEKVSDYTEGFTDKELKKTKSYDKPIISQDYSTNFNPIFPKCKAYTNGELTSVLTNCGESFLKIKENDITRFDKDEFNGIFAILKAGNQIIPFTFSPLCLKSFDYKVRFGDGGAYFENSTEKLRLTQTVTVAQDKNCEIREYKIHNNTSSQLNAEMLIYSEPILQNRRIYSNHKTFSSLFIESNYDPKTEVLTFIRRKRLDGSEDTAIRMFFDKPLNYNFELSRFNIIETNRGLKSLENAFNIKFSNSTQGPISPCVAFKFKINVKEKSEETIKLFITSESENDISTFRADTSIIAKAVEDSSYAFTKTCTNLRFSNKTKEVYDSLLSALFSKQNIRSNTVRTKNTLQREELWKHGISESLPIFTVRTNDSEMDRCKNYIKAFAMMKNSGLEFTPIICFSEHEGYEMKTRRKITSELIRIGFANKINTADGIYIINLMNFQEYALLNSLSVYSVDLSKEDDSNTISKFKNTETLDVTPCALKYIHKTGIGGFTEKGFGIDDKKSYRHKPPWSNVLANKTFGTLMSDSSLGFTYAYNSYKNKITPWLNDPTKDNHGERLYLIFGKGKDKRTYDLIRNSTAEFFQNHVMYSCEAENVSVKVKVFIPQKMNAKIIRILIENPTVEQIKLKFEADVIMNDKKYGNTVNCKRFDSSLFYENRFNSQFKDGTVFIKGHEMRPEGYGLVGRISDETTAEATVVIGYGKTFSKALQLCESLTLSRIRDEEENLTNRNENSIKIKTPSKELDYLYNGFLTNQIIKCRLLAKVGHYQCSGAFGFRDQLQDSICISTLDSSYLRRQILLCCAHQFVEGDVMHWFHSEISKNGKRSGVRSRSSDDLLWLPYAICEYVKKTNDLMFLAKKRRYLSAEILEENVEEKYVEADYSDHWGTVYDHGKRAIIKGSTKGSHGLVDFGSGDWNDGLNNLRGGETVWGTFFIITVLERFAELSNTVEDLEFYDFCVNTANDYRKAIETYAWSEDRYLRGFYPSGKEFGTENSAECKIDLITQAFASICGGFDKDRVNKSLQTADKLLVDRTKGIVKLFTPPFNKANDSPGYIMGYISGVRENGGQYTHGAVWYALGLIRNKEYEKAFEILDLINPINHSKTLNDIKTYKTEPYVLSADVYTNPAHYGMGGWSWYTGSAGWFFKVVTEELLGIKQEGNKITLTPSIPESWYSFSAEIKKDGTEISLNATRCADRTQSGKLFVDDIEQESIPLDGKIHKANYYI